MAHENYESESWQSWIIRTEAYLAHADSAWEDLAKLRPEFGSSVSAWENHIYRLNRIVKIV